jgi:hypothetical protein
MENELRRYRYTMPVLVGLCTSACPEMKPTAEELFSRTKRIEIKIRLGGETNCPPVKPYVIADPKAVAAVVSRVTVKPTGSAAGWIWPNTVSFILDDGREIRTSVGGLPETFGVHLPGQKHSRDCVLPRELTRAIGPHLDRAIDHHKKSCPKGRVAPGANGRRPSRKELLKL